MSKKATGSTFQPYWLFHEEYAKWVGRVEHDKFSAKCVVCDKIISVRSIGAAALSSHMSGANHKRNMGRVGTVVRIQTPLMAHFTSEKSSSGTASSSTSTTASSSASTTASSSTATTASSSASATPAAGAGPAVGAESVVVQRTMSMNQFVRRNEVTKTEILWILFCVSWSMDYLLFRISTSGQFYCT